MPHSAKNKNRILETIKSILQKTTLDRVDARILLHYVCQKHLAWDKTQLITKDLEELPHPVLEDWYALESARLRGYPVAYLIQKKAFHGIELFVNEHVLIPRPETELLVDSVIQHIEDALLKNDDGSPQPFRILDMGTGSGAILLAIASHFQSKGLIDSLNMVGSDISQDALEVAIKNAKSLHLTSVQWVQSDWFSNLGSQCFDCIVSNPPYIAKEDPHLEQGDLRFEPSMALTDHTDGLYAYQTILNDVSRYIHANTRIFFEHGFDQGAAIRYLFQEKGFSAIQTIRDLSGNERITSAYSPI